MSVMQYTTPTFTLTFTEQDLDLTQAQNVYVTFRYRDGVLTKTGDALTVAAKQIEVFLSQEETGRMIGNVEVQANWTMADGARAASLITTVTVDRNLLKKVVE